MYIAIQLHWCFLQMQQTFLQYMKPTLLLCNLFGIVYTTCNRTGCTGSLQKATGYFLAFPFFAMHSSILFYMVFIGDTLGSNIYNLTQLINVSNTIGFIAGIFCIYSKGTHYFAKRNAIKNLIIQVTSEMQFHSSY